MKIYVVSDLHLFDRQESFLFNQKKEKIFCDLTDQILAEGSTLVLNGDIFDLTGMTPCRRGHREFFNEAVASPNLDLAIIEKTATFRSTQELLNGIKNVFPSFFISLSRLARARRLIYIPGNHDCDFLNEDSRQVLSQILEIASTDIQWTRKFEYKNLLITHGNEFDPSNQTFNGCKNSGFLFTSALYQAVLPALRMLQVPELILSAIPAVRPEEETIVGLQHYLNDENLRKILNALARLLQRNGFFRGPRGIPAWFLAHPFPFITPFLLRNVTPERVRAILPVEEKLILTAREGARVLQKDRTDLSRLVVMGHTHELDLQENYVNLGTWIDHISGLTPLQIEQSESSAPVFIYDDDNGAQVRNFNRPNLSQTSVLWKQVWS